MSSKLMRIWALDLRSLALLRIGYGLLLFVDLLIRATDLVAHYTDYGLCPRTAVLELEWRPEFISLHMANGTWPFQALLFSIGGLAALCLAVGYRTQWAALVAWLHLISMHSRNPVILDGGDIYLRVVLFWGLFLPWGERWSLDARRRPPAPEPERCDASTLAYTFQICLVYWIAACLKKAPEWRSQGTAVYYALMVEQLTTPLAGFLLACPMLMKGLTFATLGFEALGPFLLWLGGPLRLLGVLGIVGMHASFGIFMHLGVFAWIGMVSPLGLLPRWFWERPGRALIVPLDRLFEKLDGWLSFLPGRLPVCQPPSPMLAGILSGLAIYVLLWNLTTVTPRVRIPTSLGRLLRLDQRWNMFAPKPLDEDGWYVIEADTVDGRQIDLYRGGAPLSWDKPADVAATYPNARWRKFMMNIWSADLSKWRLPYGRYLTRNWNDHHTEGERVKSFRIYFMLKKTLLDGKTAPIQKTLIWTHQCIETPGPAASPSPSPEGVPSSLPSPSGPAQE